MDRPDLLLDAPPRQPWARFQRTGDVVLTLGAGPLAGINRAVQSLLEGRPARATHAMMVVAPGFYLDSGPRTGVALVPAERYLVGPTGAAAGRRRRLAAVFRHPAPEELDRLGPELVRAVQDMLGQPYNFALFLKPERAPEADRSAFCCELVVKLFERLGLSLVPGRRPSTVLPETLAAALEARGWPEVTALYRRALAAAGPARG
jgi:hypothetical protein